MRYAGTRRSEHNPLRSVPMFQVTSIFQGPTEADRLVVQLRDALWSVSSLVRAYDKTRIALSKANSVNKAWRHKVQREAVTALNRACGAMQSNARQIAKLQARLLALAVPADLWADAAASASR